MLFASFFRPRKNTPFRHPRRVAPRKGVPVRLGLEYLEDRTLPSAYVVTTTLDNGNNANPVPGSLREAILHINQDVNTDGSSKLSYTASDPTRDEIDFAIPGAGVHTIAPASALPRIKNAVLLDGYSQPGASPNTLLGVSPQLGVAPQDASKYGDNAVLQIELSGAGAGTGAIGLDVESDNCTVQGLVINRFDSHGIDIGNFANAVIRGNFLGTDVAGTAAHDSSGNPLGNGDAGVTVDGSNATIGGASPAARNVISGTVIHGPNDSRNGSGVLVFGRATNCVIQGNFLGTDATGAAVQDTNARPLGNAAAGVVLDDGPTNCTVVGNVLSGNVFGVAALFGAGGSNIQGNMIGTDVTGTKALFNNYGVYAQGTRGLTVGGVAGTGNLISGNDLGIEILQGSGNNVIGNFLGTEVTGTAALKNNGAGIFLTQSADNNFIGGTGAGAGNLISGNGEGIDIVGAGGQCAGNVVQGNSIGTNAQGTAAIPNVRGLTISGDVINTTIGGTAPGAGNVIAYNTIEGILIYSGTGNAILGNSIHDNGSGGIDLQSGANDNQAAPVLTSAAGSASATTLSGTLHSTPNTTFTLEFVANAAPDPSGHGQGQTFLGRATVASDATGTVSFTVALAPVPAGQNYLSATATDLAGNTSGFCQDVVLPTAVVGGPYATTYGGQVTLTAAGSFDPDGDPLTYSWTVNGHAGAASGISPSLSWAQLQSFGITTVGTYAVSVLVDDGHGFTNTASTTLTVNPASTATAVTATTNPSILHQMVTFTATVAALAPGGGTPTGTVQFQIDGVNFGAPVALSGGTASFSTASLTAGPHTVTAIYGVTTNYLGSSGSLTENVHYVFGGFLPPLADRTEFHLNQTVPIKFQLTDYNGNAITALSAVTALQVLDPQGNDVLAGAGLTDLRYDGQFHYNWKTKGLSAGSYTVTLKLADGTSYTKVVQLTA